MKANETERFFCFWSVSPFIFLIGLLWHTQKLSYIAVACLCLFVVVVVFFLKVFPIATNWGLVLDVFVPIMWKLWSLKTTNIMPKITHNEELLACCNIIFVFLLKNFCKGLRKNYVWSLFNQNYKYEGKKLVWILWNYALEHPIFQAI